jgi:uncharacterized protein (DUF58 family)
MTDAARAAGRAAAAGAAGVAPAPPPLPDLAELLALRGAARGLRLSTRAAPRAVRRGVHSGAQRGRGVEFQEVRPYVPGDDPRSIDWRVTARRGRPHTKLYREERERPVWLLVNLSPMLFFGTRRQLKSALAVRTAALLAWIAALGGDRVGAVIAGWPAVRIVPPRSREAGVLPALEALLLMQPTAPTASTAAAAPGARSVPGAAQSMHEALRMLGALARPGSSVLAISDFAELDELQQTHYAALGVGCECRFFWITDPLEERSLPDGSFRAGVPGRVRVLEGERLRPRWLAAWRERETRLTQLARRVAAPLVRLDTSQSAEETLRAALPGRATAA